MNTNPQPAPQGHTAELWQTGQWLTGPTTPCIGGVTCEEQCEYTEYWRKKSDGKEPGPYPKIRHTPISVGDECVAITVGENHKELAALIIKAVSESARQSQRIAQLEGALAELLDDAKEADAAITGFLGGCDEREVRQSFPDFKLASDKLDLSTAKAARLLAASTLNQTEQGE